MCEERKTVALPRNFKIVQPQDGFLMWCAAMHVLVAGFFIALNGEKGNFFMHQQL